ncbi:NADH:flavin oxidoreductase/NADH oxidase [Dactylonectria estremocensis]|uniref:NADH:flavin oxidoreductase/NADH oxidase n=1 Tax=Dactylonectria estremocensis TaxID=1079267 RepID=A0A9P9IP52_9HYPO|nr:NADH:flavin oxidoreductase/NADH oxidase [Dactylonectria estremocensis]
MQVRMRAPNTRVSTLGQSIAMAALQDPKELVCGLTLPNRFVKAAMSEKMDNGSNIPPDDLLRIYKEWSKGRWGMLITGSIHHSHDPFCAPLTLVTGNVHVDPAHLGAKGDFSIDGTRLSEPAYKEGWRKWADACETPVILQINHPGRQSARAAGTRGPFAPAVAPSAIPLDFGSGILQRLLRALAFGSPRELTTEEVEEIIEKFVQAAKFAYESGFSGVEVHAAHGYLLAQFMSSRTNTRTDGYGGSPSKRAEAAVQILRRVRAATSPTFCVGLKLNSADMDQSGDTSEDFLEQLQLLVECGIDFLEISGGSYENPTMSNGANDTTTNRSASTVRREAFFLSFASIIREKYPSLPLIVTGGFRTLGGMEDAVKTGQCDFVGLGRPAVMTPHAPTELLNSEDLTAKLRAPSVDMEWWKKWLRVRALGASTETVSRPLLLRMDVAANL